MSSLFVSNNSLKQIGVLHIFPINQKKNIVQCHLYHRAYTSLILPFHHIIMAIFSLDRRFPDNTQYILNILLLIFLKPHYEYKKSYTQSISQ